MEFPKLIFTFFPLFDETHSWASQGLVQACIGCFILGYDSSLNLDVISSVKGLVLVAGWMSFILGLFYMFLVSVFYICFKKGDLETASITDTTRE